MLMNTFNIIFLNMHCLIQNINENNMPLIITVLLCGAGALQILLRCLKLTSPHPNSNFQHYFPLLTIHRTFSHLQYVRTKVVSSRSVPPITFFISN